ncbi:MAG TPA: hypothetical protein VF820_03890 [Patescibacteria group bacterium]
MGKYNVLVLAITVLLLGYLTYFAVSQTNLLKTKNNTTNQANLPTPTVIPATPFIDDASPELIASNFYSIYQGCMIQTASPNSSLSLSQYCRLNTRLTLPSYNDAVLSSPSNTTDIDPVFCAKAPPKDIAKDIKFGTTSKIDATTTIVPIIETYDTDTVTINFTIQKNDLNQWKVAKITCK